MSAAKAPRGIAAELAVPCAQYVSSPARLGRVHDLAGQPRPADPRRATDDDAGAARIGARGGDLLELALAADERPSAGRRRDAR